MKHLFREHFDAVQKADELDCIIWNLCKDYVNEHYPDECTYMDDWSWSGLCPDMVSIDITTTELGDEPGSRHTYERRIQVPITELKQTD